MEEAATFILTKLLFQRGLALVYLIAFLVALNQFIPLLGEHGLLPVHLFVKNVRFAQSPSLFFFFPKDIAFQLFAAVGVILSVLTLTGISERFGSAASAVIWGVMWLLYLSFVNVGQTFYSFGWESMLLEAGFYAMFLGGAGTNPPVVMIWILRFMLFRVMFGAGMIKLRGDDCWRDLTCLFYHYETQPIPNPFSWYFHWLPAWIHKASVLFNHFVELIVPFFYFVPHFLIAPIAGLLTIFFHGLLIVSGNFSFLSLLTIVIAFSTFNDKMLTTIFHLPQMAAAAPPPFLAAAALTLGVVVIILGIKPVLNMLSPHQIMNTSYNPFHLVGTYGAFGSITRPRYEVIIQGTDDAVITDDTVWKEYPFKGKPGDPARRPVQIAPYHLRLDWLMWFAGFSSYEYHPWFVHLMAKLLEGDQKVLALLRENPFPDQPPQFIRARLYRYEFTTPEERKKTGNWWKRTFEREYFPVVSLEHEGLEKFLEAQGW